MKINARCLSSCPEPRKPDVLGCRHSFDWKWHSWLLGTSVSHQEGRAVTSDAFLFGVLVLSDVPTIVLMFLCGSFVDFQGLTECYECQPKPTQKTFPGCTIRNTPSEPIHCIVWAKYLFKWVCVVNWLKSLSLKCWVNEVVSLWWQQWQHSVKMGWWMYIF